jgi:hypothetical protein
VVDRSTTSYNLGAAGVGGASPGGAAASTGPTGTLASFIGCP